MIKSIDELTIKQYLKLKAIAEAEIDEMQMLVKMYSELSGLDVEDVRKLSYEELNKINDIKHLENNNKIKLKFKIGNKRFKIIWQEQELSTEQYIDVTHFCSQNNLEDNLHNILASLAIEVNWVGKTKGYDGSKHKEVAQLFYNNVKIKDVYPLVVFFCEYYQELTRGMLTYFQEHPQAIQDFMISGDGLQQ